MKIYVIMQKATEYNDEYDVVQEEGAKIYKAYRNKPTEEQVKAAAWEAIKGKTPDYDGNWPDDMAYVEEIEVDENQIVQANEIPVPEKSKPNSYGDAKQRAKEARAEAATLAKEAVRVQALELFNKYPDLVSFSWTQYTPYFNDGDECVFHVHSDYPEIELKGFDIEDGSPTVLYFRDNNSDKVYVVKNDYYDKRVEFSYGRRGSSLVTGVKVESPDYLTRSKVEDELIAEKKSKGYGCPLDDIKVFLASMDEEDMKETFGDHVEVVATRDGFKIEEYEHD